jgi:exosortase/archaeosortase family protein
VTAHRVAALLGALLAALWPHWIYVARRSFDGSDEPWGVLALITVLVLLVRERGALAVPTRAALVASGVLAIGAACATFWLPPLAAAAVAMLALGVFVVHALAHRPATALAALLLLALPVIASLQFYLGFPLRALTAQAVAHLLAMVDLDISAAGAALFFQGKTVLVDAPCAGIGMLWVGSYTAALLSYLQRASAMRTAVNAMIAALLVLAANIARNAALFFPEAGLVRWPAWSHEAIGLGAFALAIVPLIAFTYQTQRIER